MELLFLMVPIFSRLSENNLKNTLSLSRLRKNTFNFSSCKRFSIYYGWLFSYLVTKEIHCLENPESAMDLSFLPHHNQSSYHLLFLSLTFLLQLYDPYRVIYYREYSSTSLLYFLGNLIHQNILSPVTRDMHEKSPRSVNISCCSYSSQSIFS